MQKQKKKKKNEKEKSNSWPFENFTLQWNADTVIFCKGAGLQAAITWERKSSQNSCHQPPFQTSVEDRRLFLRAFTSEEVRQGRVNSSINIISHLRNFKHQLNHTNKSHAGKIIKIKHEIFFEQVTFILFPNILIICR